MALVHGGETDSVVCRLCHRRYPPPYLKVCKVFEPKTLSPDFGCDVKCGSPAWSGRASISFSLI